MPQFTANDNLSCYFKVVLMERWDALDANERTDFKPMVDTLEKMKEWVCDFLDEVSAIDGVALFTAIKNSTDWEEVFEEVSAYIEDPTN